MSTRHFINGLLYLFAAVLMANPTSVHAQALVYENDFQGASVDSGWSNTLRSTTPVGSRRFLGPFGNDTTMLSLAGLPVHNQVTLSFDLFTILTWDGNSGPDLWSLQIVNGPKLLQTTFSHAPASEPYFNQAFPDSYPGGNHPGTTGSIEQGTLGYPVWSGYGGVGDAVYHLSFTFTHVSDALALAFAMSGGEGIYNESWGLDNVRVWVREGMTQPDADGDGYPAGLDCNDSDATVHPGRPEVFGNGLDDDCNPSTSDATAPASLSFWVPGNPNSTLTLKQGNPPVLAFHLVGTNGYAREGQTPIPTLKGCGTITSAQVVGNQVVVIAANGRYVSRDGFLYTKTN